MSVNIREIKDPVTNEVFYPLTDIHGLKNNGQNAIDSTPTPGSDNLITSGGVASSIVYDISAANNGTEYANITAALGTNGANVPQSIRKGGMSIKYVENSDHKYVQYRLMATSFSTTESDWQGVDDVPTAGSENLVKSGGAKIDAATNQTIVEGSFRIWNQRYFNNGAPAYKSNYNIASPVLVKAGETIIAKIEAHSSYKTFWKYISSSEYEPVGDTASGVVTLAYTAPSDMYIAVQSMNTTEIEVRIIKKYQFAKDVDFQSAKGGIRKVVTPSFSSIASRAIDGYGVASYNSSYSITTAILVKAGETINASISSNSMPVFCFTDASQTFFIPVGTYKGTYNVVQKYSYTAENDCYITICYQTANGCAVTIDSFEEISADNEPIGGSNNLVRSGGVVKVKLFEQKALVASTGDTTNSVAGYNVTQFLRVKEGLVIPCKGVSGNRASVCFYDANYQFIEGGNITVSSASDVTLSSNNIPQNAAYFRAAVPDNAAITGASMDTLSADRLSIDEQMNEGYLVSLQNGIAHSVVPGVAIAANNYKLNGYYIRLDGTVNSSSVSGYCATLFIKVRDGISIDCKYITGDNDDGLGLGVFFYNSDFAPITGSIIIDADTTVTLSSANIPANARYFRANIVSNGYVRNIAITDIVTSLIKAETSNPRIGTVLGIGNGNLAFTPKNVIVNELVTVQEVAIIPGKFLRANGNINTTTASNYNITPYLPVRVGFSISCRYVATDGGPAVLFYDEFFNFIQSGTIFIDSSKTVVLTDANIPAGAVYFRANVVDGYQPMPYFYPYDNLQKLASAISGYLPTYAMAGKKYCNLGSSTSAASWHRDTIAALGMTFEKFSIGGAHFYCGDNAAYNLNEVAADSPDNVIMNQIGRLFNKNSNDGYYPDIITLLSGLNDCYGELTTTFEQAMAADISEYDTPQLWFTAPSAIKGDSMINLRAVIEMLSVKFPLSQLIIMTYQHVYSNSFNQDSLQHFYDVEKQIAAYYAIPVIDFYLECGWNEITASSFTTDGTHPNVAGSKMMSNFLKTALVRTVSLRQ